MGLMEPPPVEAYAVSAAPPCNGTVSTVNGGDPPCGKQRKVGIGAVGLPLEVGTRVMCRWRNQKLHPATSLKMTHHQKRKIDEAYVEAGHEELDAASLWEH